MKYLRIMVFVFVILSVGIGLAILQVSTPDFSSEDVPQTIEAGGKIIDVHLSDGVIGSHDDG